MEAMITYWDDEIQKVAKRLTVKVRRRNKGQKTQLCNWAIEVRPSGVVVMVKVLVGEGVGRKWDYERGW